MQSWNIQEKQFSGKYKSDQEQKYGFLRIRRRTRSSTIAKLKDI
jgi:hypothetical protein